jgi:hypothetical protein
MRCAGRLVGGEEIPDPDELFAKGEEMTTTEGVAILRGFLDMSAEGEASAPGTMLCIEPLLTSSRITAMRLASRPVICSCCIPIRGGAESP